MKTVTLETAKALKEAGYPQDAYWCYMDLMHEDDRAGKVTRHSAERAQAIIVAAAPTAGELMEWLVDNGCDLEIWAPMDTARYSVADGRSRDSYGFTEWEADHDNPAEALGLLALKILQL